MSKKLKVRPLLDRCPASLACEQVGWGPRLGPSPRKVQEADQRSMIKEYLKCVNLHYNFIITITILVIVTNFTLMLVLRLLIPMITVIT